jgi:hypothetical protein
MKLEEQGYGEGLNAAADELVADYNWVWRRLVGNGAAEYAQLVAYHHLSDFFSELKPAKKDEKVFRFKD